MWGFAILSLVLLPLSFCSGKLTAVTELRGRNTDHVACACFYILCVYMLHLNHGMSGPVTMARSLGGPPSVTAETEGVA